MARIWEFFHNHRNFFRLLAFFLVCFTLVPAVIWLICPACQRCEPAIEVLAILTALIGAPTLYDLFFPFIPSPISVPAIPSPIPAQRGNLLARLLPGLLAPANETIAKVWRKRLLIPLGVALVASICTRVVKALEILPEGILHEQFIYLAFAIAFVTALPLTMFPSRVLTVSFAQMGVATSWLYLGYGFTGALPSYYESVITFIFFLLALVFIVLFLGGILFWYREKLWSDLTVGSVLMVAFVVLWLYPIWDSWR